MTWSDALSDENNDHQYNLEAHLMDIVIHNNLHLRFPYDLETLHDF